MLISRLRSIWSAVPKKLQWFKTHLGMHEVDHSSCQGDISESVCAEIKPNVDVCLAKGSIQIVSISVFHCCLRGTSRRFSNLIRWKILWLWFLLLLLTLLLCARWGKMKRWKMQTCWTSWKNVPYNEGKFERYTDVPHGFCCHCSKAEHPSLVHKAN